MKKFFAALLVGCMMFAFTACAPAGTSSNPASTAAPSTAAPSDTTPKEVNIGVLIYKFDDAYISTVRTAIEKYAAESTDITVKLDMQDGRGDQATQNDQLDVLISKNVDALLVNMVDEKAADGVAQKAKTAGIPVIFFNKEPAKEVLQSVDGLFVGTTASEAGVMQGDILADLYEKDKGIDLNKDGKLQYVIFKGEATHPEAIARTEYCLKQSETRGLKMDAVVKDPIVAEWNTEKAKTMMESTLAANKDKIEVVFCNNDDMALGVIAALNTAGYNNGGPDDGKWIPVIGVDATETGLAAYNAKKMYGTVKQDGDAMGKALIATIKNAATGKTGAAGYIEGTGYELATDGISVRIPYSKVS